MTWAASGIFWKNKRSFIVSGSSWTTVTVLEPVMRSFISLINVERKYMKAKAKTRTDFWASLCFRENKKKFNGWVPKPQASRRLYLSGPHPLSSWKKKTNKHNTQNKQKPPKPNINNKTPQPQIPTLLHHHLPQTQRFREAQDCVSQAHPY